MVEGQRGAGAGRAQGAADGKQVGVLPEPRQHGQPAEQSQPYWDAHCAVGGTQRSS